VQVAAAGPSRQCRRRRRRRRARGRASCQRYIDRTGRAWERHGWRWHGAHCKGVDYEQEPAHSQLSVIPVSGLAHGRRQPHAAAPGSGGGWLVGHSAAPVREPPPPWSACLLACQRRETSRRKESEKRGQGRRSSDRRGRRRGACRKGQGSMWHERRPRGSEPKHRRSSPAALGTQPVGAAFATWFCYPD
jgi:hypothetical protein